RRQQHVIPSRGAGRRGRAGRPRERGGNRRWNPASARGRRVAVEARRSGSRASADVHVAPRSRGDDGRVSLGDRAPMTVAPVTAEAVAAASPRQAWASLSAQRRLQLAGLVLIDALTAAAGFFLAYHLRYTLGVGGDVPGESFVPLTDYSWIVTLFVASLLVWNQLRGTYVLPRGASMASEAMAILGATGAVTMAVLFAVTVLHYFASSRLMFVYVWLFASILGIVGRILVRSVLAHLYLAGYGTERVIVVGGHRLARMVMQLLAQQRHLGYRVLGFVDDEDGSDFGRFPALGSVQQLPKLI